ncbi:MAG: cobalamin B12-binding domain-containing protein [Thermodesulfobacteriota bacterium]
MTMTRPIKVLLAKLGLDIHWRGVVSISRLLRDAGMEVIYLGNQFPEAIAAAALQEAPDVVGLSTLSGNHLSLGPKVVRLLREKGMADIPVIMGGVIPPQDMEELKRLGIRAVFPPNTPVSRIISFIEAEVRERRA